MDLAYLRLRTLAAACLAVAVSAPASGCILTSDDDDGGGGGGGTDPSGPSGPSSASASDPTVPDSTSGSASDSAGTGGSTGMLPPGCGDNLLEDPGFEGGTPNMAWLENSAAFGTPICDATCTEQPGAVPYSGSWWVWFGGIEMQETASVSQAVTIAPDTAILQFRFWINTGGGMGNDVFSVEVDDTTVFMATDAEQTSYDNYTLVEVDVDQFADGESHMVTFGAEITGVGLTNFFLDDVALVSCGEGGSTSATTDPTTMTPTSTSTMGSETESPTDTSASATGSGSTGG